MQKNLVLLLILTSIGTTSFSQNTRIGDPNTIGWYAFSANIKLNKVWTLNSEFQWRRDELIKEPMQNLLRLGINYSVNPKLSVRAGYALAETYNYGDIPLNNLGKQFTEHRSWQMVNLTDKVKAFELSHRFMLEQRFIGRYSKAQLSKEDQFIFSNRFRYMFRVQVPLKGNTMADNTPYLAVYDELLIGFGKNVNENVFDQNRLGVLLGYRFNSKIRIEGGYLNQIAQLSREVEGRNVFQNNKGILISTVFNF
jgi:long-subunit fatty acid transport protein